jgi:hypothetical protein
MSQAGDAERESQTLCMAVRANDAHDTASVCHLAASAEWIRQGQAQGPCGAASGPPPRLIDQQVTGGHSRRGLARDDQAHETRLLTVCDDECQGGTAGEQAM